jgi:mRNA interferase MazF
MSPSSWLVSQGEVYWHDFGPPIGSEPGGRRPVVVIQGERYNHSTWSTTVVASITTRLDRAQLSAMVFVPRGTAGLTKDSVINLTSLSTVNKSELVELMGRLPSALWQDVIRAMDQMMGRPA